MKRQNFQGGFSLVEVLVGVFILSVIFLGTMKFFGVVVSNPVEIFIRTDLALSANSIYSQVRLTPWEKLGDWDSYVDHVNGVRRAVKVDYVEPDTTSGVLIFKPTAGSTKHRRVTVTTETKGRSKSLSRIFSDD